MDRKQRLQALARGGAGFGLEIGPSHNPIFPKSEGFNVETLDYADAASLRVSLGAGGIDVSAIEEVDYVSDGRLLHEVIPRRGEYDYIFSSHAIEHVTDLVGYFASCEMLLKPGGVLAMAVPDKRYTFDVFQQVTTTGQALEAYHAQRHRHSHGAVFDCVANMAIMDGRNVWSMFDVGRFELMNPLSEARERFNRSISDPTSYSDIHGWIFTPMSFRLVVQDLNALGLISLKEVALGEEGSLEFHTSLSTTGAGHGLDRLALQKGVMREHVRLGAQILANDDPFYAGINAMF